MNTDERRSKYTIKSQYLDEHIQSRLINLDTSSDEGQIAEERREDEDLIRIENYITLRGMNERFKRRFGIELIKNDADKNVEILRTREYRRERYAFIRQNLQIRMHQFFVQINQRMREQDIDGSD